MEYAVELCSCDKGQICIAYCLGVQSLQSFHLLLLPHAAPAKIFPGLVSAFVQVHECRSSLFRV